MEKAFLLTRKDTLSVAGPEDYLGAVETAFRLAAEGRVDAAPVVTVPREGGAFHVKAAGMRGLALSAFLVLRRFPIGVHWVVLGCGLAGLARIAFLL